ncbi:MAG TPA: hypothetical protein VJQ57_05405 [Acidimicrobiia bacterium]|nr:hypothetical protein [Acidimicrobiia bacterium]
MVERLIGWRVVADPASLDELEGMSLRFAPDDALVLGDAEVAVHDPHAIVERDMGWVSLPMAEQRALDLIASHASFEVSPDRPVLVQGMVAGLPVKVYLDGNQGIFIIAAPFGHELEERLGQ